MKLVVRRWNRQIHLFEIIHRSKDVEQIKVDVIHKGNRMRHLS